VSSSPEARLWSQLRTNRPTERRFELTRIENSAVPGTPDVMVCDDRGDIHLVELKVCTANAVRLSPHQIAFLTRHAHARAWIIVKRTPRSGTASVLVYRGADAVALAECGLRGADPVAEFTHPVDWRAVWQTLSPG
jgi:hypothetical protein